MDFASSHAFVGEEQYSEIQQDELEVDLLSNLSSSGLAQAPAAPPNAPPPAEPAPRSGLFARRERSRSRSPSRDEQQQQQQPQQRSPGLFSRLFGASAAPNTNTNNTAAPAPANAPASGNLGGVASGASASASSDLVARKRVFHQAQADTNVAAIKFGTLAADAEQVFAGDPCVCNNKDCGAILNHQSITLNKEQWKQQQQQQQQQQQHTDNDNKHESLAQQGSADALDVIMADASDGTKPSPASSPSQREPQPLDDELVWVCEFCGHVNIIDAMDPAERPNTESRDYVVAPGGQHDEKSGDNTGAAQSGGDGAVIFVLDISGSMCVTTEVAGTFTLKGVQQNAADFDIPMGSDERAVPQQRRRHDVTYVSRLQCVSAAIDSQLSAWSVTHPNKQVALVTFNNEVTIIGDGTQPDEIVTGDKLEHDDVLQQIGTKHGIGQAKPISTTHTQLSNKVFSLQEKGQTALGPALRIAVAMAAQRIGTTIIVATDGLANIGVGSLDGFRTDVERLAVEGWYESVGVLAKSAGTTISIITIAGAESRLEDLSLAVNATGGNVDRVDPLQLTQNFGSMLANPVIATQVSATFLLHRALCFRNTAAPAPAPAPGGPSPDHSAGLLFHNQNRMTRSIGSVSADTEITFEYQVRDRQALATYQHINKLPFQVQIHYTKLNGTKCVRVLSKSQPVTLSRDVAERSARLDVLAANVAQSSSRMAEQGEYHMARAKNLVWGKLMKRAADRTDQEPQHQQQQQHVYQQWVGETAQFDRSLHVQQQQLDVTVSSGAPASSSLAPVPALGPSSSSSSSAPASRAARAMRGDREYAELHKFKNKSSAAYHTKHK